MTNHVTHVLVHTKDTTTGAIETLSFRYVSTAPHSADEAMEAAFRDCDDPTSPDNTGFIVLGCSIANTPDSFVNVRP